MGDPAISVCYKVTIDGLMPLGLWTKVEGLGFEYQVTEYREGGVNGYTHKIVGPSKYTNLRLSRPVDSTSDMLMIWLQSNLVKIVPQTMSIEAMDAAGNTITTWSMTNVVPVKWSGPTLDVLTNNIATETLEVTYQEILGLGGVGAALAGALTGASDLGVSF